MTPCQRAMLYERLEELQRDAEQSPPPRSLAAIVAELAAIVRQALPNPDTADYWPMESKP